jgi:MFS family permease
LGLRLAPMWLGETLAVAGLILSLLWVHETLPFSRLEATLGSNQAGTPSFWHVFRNTSWGDRSLFAVCQAGLVNNLNDGLAWGLLPLFFAANGLALTQISILSALYPATWGITQLGTGALSDVIGRKALIASGMVLQGVAILLFALTTEFSAWSVAAVSLGIGTAMVYPTLLAAIGDSTLPSWRATAVGVYRLWRDSGYAFGAILAGIIADQVGIRGAIAAVGVLTLLSGFIVAVTMRPRQPSTVQ